MTQLISKKGEPRDEKRGHEQTKTILYCLGWCNDMYPYSTFLFWQQPAILGHVNARTCNIFYCAMFEMLPAHAWFTRMLSYQFNSDYTFFRSSNLIRLIVPTVAICRGMLRWLQFMVELHCRVIDIGLMQQRCIIIHILFSVFVLATVVLGGVTFLSSTRGHGCPTDLHHGTSSRLIWSPSLWVSSVSFLTSVNLASSRCCSTLVSSGCLCVFSDRR